MKISVIIPAFNADQTIKRSISSVLNQRRSADEIIVVDDGSTDKTADIVRSFGDKVKLIQQPNAGVSAARNTGIRAATGDWIAFLDSDDEWLDDFLFQQVKLLQRNPELVWTTANFLMCWCGQQRQTEQLPPEKAKAILNGKDYFDDYFQAFLRQAWGCTDTMLIKKEVISQAGFFEPGRPTGEDLDLWWRIAYQHPKIGYIAKPLAIYHMGVADSATKEHTAPQFIADLLCRNLQLAEKHDALNRFTPCAQRLLRFYIDKYLHDERIGAIPEFIKKFGHLLPARYKIGLKVLTVCPRATSFCMPLLTRLNKLFRISVGQQEQQQ